MPSPQDSSLSQLSTLRQDAIRDWLAHCATVEAVLEIERLLRGVPSHWLRWVETRVAAVERRGIRIRSPLSYRLATLWQGVIALQECKFLCDFAENALRQAVTAHAAVYGLRWSDLCETIPTLTSNKVLDGRTAAANPPITADCVAAFTFYQLTETIARNWVAIGGHAGGSAGFRACFWGYTPCRSVLNFRSDFAEMRRIRNEVAHSKRLLLQSDTLRAYGLVHRWLKPLGVSLDEKIWSYRRRRPRFLQEIEIASTRRLTHRCSGPQGWPSAIPVAAELKR